ncbi:hypothetical protein [Nocardioides sp. WS12]|uniref:hypothetical protein n=1 Tax=Nocardioides sp. WS12 TaxID=2486272 RepID=UPI0015F9E8E2|nr:hypothetical protein [Nocardioides sp. WS12]
MSTVSRALRLAGENPGSPVPCPVCVAGVKGANLERHLGKVHQGVAEADGAHGSRWGGPERIGSRWLLGVALLAGAAAAAYTVASGNQDDRIILGGIGLVAVAMIVWGAVAWGAPLFPGRLRVDERGVVLRHSYGLGRRRLRTIDRVVLGGAWESRPTGNSGNDDTYESVDVRVGSYLQLVAGRRRITVHCRTAGVVRTTWTGWQQGAKRKRVDITLDPAEFVALQFALWEIGVLAPRPAGGADGDSR